MLNLLSSYKLLTLFVFCGVQRTLRNNHMYAEYILYFPASTPCDRCKMFLRVFYSIDKMIYIDISDHNLANKNIYELYIRKHGLNCAQIIYLVFTNVSENSHLIK